MKFLTRGVSAESAGDFSKNCFPAIFGGHLEFLRKKKQERIYLINGTRWSDFNKIFDPQGICRFYCLLATFPKIVFPPFLVSHLEFLHKMQKCIYLVNGERQSNFNGIFDQQGICKVYWHFSPKIVFLPFLTPIFNFGIKTQKQAKKKKKLKKNTYSSTKPCILG